MSGRCTVLVCGDPSRGDDGAAIAAVARLERGDPPATRVRRVGQLEPDDLVNAVAGGGRCVVVDAVRGIEPGRVIVAPLRSIAASDGPQPASSHALPLEIVIGLAEALGADLDRAVFVGIGGRRFELGTGLSPAVNAALDVAAATIDQRIAGRAFVAGREVTSCA
jgi:hydrogenase maturation protease